MSGMMIFICVMVVLSIATAGVFYTVGKRIGFALAEALKQDREDRIIREGIGLIVLLMFGMIIPTGFFFTLIGAAVGARKYLGEQKAAAT